MSYTEMLQEINLFITLQRGSDIAESITARLDAARSFNDISDIYCDVMAMGEEYK